MKTTLLITTYNWKDALEVVLESVLNQTHLPDEVIIADDGSRDDTRAIITSMQESFPVPLIHSWMPDDGFQLSRSRNKAISIASGDYILMVDGDIYLSPTFIESHKSSARKGWFIQGSRVMARSKITKKILEEKIAPNFFSCNINNRHNAISNQLISRFFSKEKNNTIKTRGCNMAFWREDVLAVNGFNQDFIGWGSEDNEFTLRMLHLGRRRLYLKFSGTCYHLHHNENSREMLTENRQILEQTTSQKLIRCKNGIDQYL